MAPTPPATHAHDPARRRARLRAQHRALHAGQADRPSSRASSGWPRPTSSSSRRTRTRAARVPRCARRSPPRPTSCRAIRTATASRSRRRWPRATASAPRASCSATAPTTSSSSSRRRSSSPATRPCTRATRSPSTRWPRRRAARTASRSRRTTYGHDLRGDAPGDHRPHPDRVRRQPEQPDRHLDRTRGARGVHRVGAAGRRWSCSTRRTTSTSSRAAVAPSPQWIDRYPNLVVSRTFSKAYGLAALRVGYGLMHPRVADMLNRVRQPFNVNALAQAAAVAALGDAAYVEESRAINRAGMRRWRRGCARWACPGCRRTRTSCWSRSATPAASTSGCLRRASSCARSPTTGCRSTCA